MLQFQPRPTAAWRRGVTRRCGG